MLAYYDCVPKQSKLIRIILYPHVSHDFLKVSIDISIHIKSWKGTLALAVTWMYMQRLYSGMYAIVHT